jgi:DNA mismatch repair protein MutL
VGPAARAKGTTIEIRSLFYNVPARKKFQKSPAASSADITKMVTQLSLAHPEVGFTLVMQNRTQFSLPAATDEDFPALLQRRAEALLGPDFCSYCRPFDLREKGYWGKGLIADPTFSRHNRSGQYLFVNRRPVVCPPVSYAMRDAYGTRLGPDRHPVYLLHLTIAPDLVDVNVHPQKREIRLREEGVLKAALHRAVNNALCSTLEAPLTRNFAFNFAEPPVFREEELPVFREEEAPPQPVLPIEHPLQIIGLFGPWLLVDAATYPVMPERELAGIFWIDLPAAEARVRFDTLVKNAEKTPASQGLLIPADVSFSKAEAHLLSVHLDTVQKLGIQIRECGDRAFLVEGIPPFMKEAEIYPTLIGIIGTLQEHDLDKRHSASLLHKLSAALSRPPKSGYVPEEARRIAQLLLKSEDPLHCPKGKPTFIHIRENDIESWFTSKSHRPLTP